jgi:hypothetical protein
MSTDNYVAYIGIDWAVQNLTNFGTRISQTSAGKKGDNLSEPSHASTEYTTA